MAAAGRLSVHVRESPAAAPRTLVGPRRAPAGRLSSAAASEPAGAGAGAGPGPAARRELPPRLRQAEATKRKHQTSSEAPPAKRRNEASFLPARKAAAKETQRTFKGKAQKTFSPKKSLVGVTNGNREQKLCIRTSSLFKNNPEIPELHRPVVKQVQEKVFTSDAFHELDLHPHLISTINTVLNMTSMTSVQKQSIPALLEGRDALVRSQTGSGKTLAYCIPVVQSLQAMKPKIQRSEGPYALVLVPTRELALQSFDTVQKLLKPFTWIVPGVLMGGEKRKSEKARLRKGINILISTPGRLVDHIKSTKNIHFCRIRWLILDEADRILDLGFEKDITVILNALNAECQKRQNVLLSATLTEGVTWLAGISLLNPVRISVLDEHHGQSDLKGRAVPEASPLPACGELDSFAIPESLDQHVTLVPSKLRLVTLAAFILQKCKFEKDQKMLVFFSSCELVEFHYHLFLQTLPSCSGTLASGRPPSASTQLKFLRLHGNMAQEGVSGEHTEGSLLAWKRNVWALCGGAILSKEEVTKRCQETGRRRDNQESEQDLNRLENTSLELKEMLKSIWSSTLLVLTFVVLIIKGVEPQKRELAQGHSRTQLPIYHKTGLNFLSGPGFMHFINPCFFNFRVPDSIEFVDFTISCHLQCLLLILLVFFT
ncbi:probable ATP-dependent RNA helicase DDX31 isoform X2 [Vulpes lagopus]|uniref:probable ATP-dependent RNA helicase DDX31 isoform X2 n=1 Tax=Vulpes lagopus TaxID=494514 RepID=UPI001BC93C2B|nr:probable ATP-dependent RNA helicase DDX31 isoform X2 [Vulpes lagopus]